MANFPDCRLEDTDILTGSVSLGYDSDVLDRIEVDSDSASFDFFSVFSYKSYQEYVFHSDSR